MWNARDVSSVVDLCNTWLDSKLDQALQKKQTHTPPWEKEPVTASIVQYLIHTILR